VDSYPPRLALMVLPHKQFGDMTRELMKKKDRYEACLDTRDNP